MSQSPEPRHIDQETTASTASDDEVLRDLMVQYQGGVLDAFRELYVRLAPELRRYMRYLTRGSDAADDLLQEAFLQMHRSRGAYNRAYAVRPWAFGVARNVVLMNRRAARRWANVHDASVDVPEVPVPPDLERLAAADEIRRGLARLPDDQAEALTLHHVWGFAFEEIAGLVGVSAAAARARASRGMAQLRAELRRTRSAAT